VLWKEQKDGSGDGSILSDTMQSCPAKWKVRQVELEQRVPLSC
jgi:hypothetical protein